VRAESLKVLVIEDDEETATRILRGLRKLGHAADHISDGRDGFAMASGGGHDALIVDRMVPGLDGLSLVRALRAAKIDAPVLFLTALRGVGDRVEGLEAGGDDYLVKPFAFAELLARLQALARRPPLSFSATTLCVSNLHLDVLRRTVIRGGGKIELQPREFRLLEFMMRHTEQVITRTMLLESVWEFHFDPKTNIVETHMSRVRGKISRGGRDPELIHTVRGSGYVLRAPNS
jgi:two-component system OmpR family response regulator